MSTSQYLEGEYPHNLQGAKKEERDETESRDLIIRESSRVKAEPITLYLDREYGLT